MTKPWDDLTKDATKTSKPNAPEDIWEKPGKPGYDEASKNFDKLNPGNVQPINTKYGPGKKGTLADGSTISIRPGSSGGPPTIQINPPSGKPVKIRY